MVFTELIIKSMARLKPSQRFATSDKLKSQNERVFFCEDTTDDMHMNYRFCQIQITIKYQSCRNLDQLEKQGMNFALVKSR